MSTSITASVKEKYETLNAANFPNGVRPALYFDQAPQLVDGLQIRPPYVVFTEGAHKIETLDLEHNNMVTIQLVFQAFAHSLGDVDAICNAIRWNGGTVGQGTGFDYGTIDTLTPPRHALEIVPTSEPRQLEDTLDKDGRRIHAAKLEFRVRILEKS